MLALSHPDMQTQVYCSGQQTDTHTYIIIIHLFLPGEIGDVVQSVVALLTKTDDPL